MQPSIQMLAQGEIEQIDAASRRILHEVGILVEKRDALELFQDAGAEVDIENKLVKIPRNVIDIAIQNCEPYVTLYGRGDRAPMYVGGDNTYFGTTGFPTNLLDHETGRYRSCLYEDLVTATRLADVLNPPDYILPNIGATDIPAEYVDLFEFKAAITNTGKHIQAQAQGKDNLRKIITMAEYVAGGTEILKEKPFFSILVTLTSPLNLRPDSTELIIAGAAEGLPLFIESGPMSGATSPATLDHFRKEMWTPSGFERSSITDGEDKSSSHFENRTQHAIREALAAHQPPDLPVDCSQRLDEIILG